MNQSIRVEGWAWFGSELLKSENLGKLFSQKNDFQAFEKCLVELDGAFSVVIEKDEETWICSDRLRHFPQFYAQVERNWIVSTSALEIWKRLNKPTSTPFLTKMFFETGYITGPRTLVPNIFSLQAGEIVRLKKGQPPERFFYFDFAKKEASAIHITISPAVLASKIETVFERFFQKNEARFLAIPLSGGFDSRLIAAMVRKLGNPKNTLFYTYGRSKNPEFAPAKRVAETLGLNWLAIEYDLLPHTDFLKRADLRAWLDEGFELQSMPFLQDWPSVFYLKSRNLVPPDTLFVPGHSGDMLAGSHLTKILSRPQSLEKVARAIVERHFSNFNAPKKAFEKDVLEQIAGLENAPPHLVFESWNIRERQSKYILNSARVFKKLGFDVEMPLWSNELIQFFQATPFEKKWQKRLYDQTLRAHFFEPMNINFTTKVQDSVFKKTLQTIKKPLKKLTPHWFLELTTQLDDFFCYREMVDELIKEAGGREQFLRPAQPNFYNAELAQWIFWKHFGRT